LDESISQKKYFHYSLKRETSYFVGGCKNSIVIGGKAPLLPPKDKYSKIKTKTKTTERGKTSLSVGKRPLSSRL